MRKINTVLIAAFMLSFLTPLLHAQDVYTNNVVIVLDASGSMNESMRDAQGNRVRKIDAAKSGIYEVLKQISDSTHIGVLVFSARGIRDEWIYPLGKKDEAKLRKALEPVEPSGGTPLGTYMKIGADRLLQEREKQHNYGSYRLLVVTDGEANNEPSDRVDKYTLDIISRGITLDVIGVDMAKRHTLATKVHSYRSADDPASLTRAIKEVFAEVSDKKDQSDFSEKAFDELASIPNEVASAMITTLSDTGNQPIGEKPKLKPVVETPSRHVPPTPSTPQPQDKGMPCVFWALIALIALVVVVGVIVIMSRGY